MSTAGDEGKREGMGRAARHADPHWWQCMLESAREVAETTLIFTTDEVRILCHLRHPEAHTHELRACGPLMTETARLGYCMKHNDPPRKSSMPVCHSRPKQKWYSLIYRGRRH